jgi:hypothetical protein
MGLLKGAPPGGGVGVGLSYVAATDPYIFYADDSLIGVLWANDGGWAVFEFGEPRLMQHTGYILDDF